MQYAMLIHYNEPEFLALPAADRQRLIDECTAWAGRLAAERRCTGGMRLEQTTTATTLRERNRKLEIFDGPFAETKEVLGGLVILEARDLDDAISLARGFPFLAAGFSLELRPVADAGAPPTAVT